MIAFGFDGIASQSNIATTASVPFFSFTETFGTGQTVTFTLFAGNVATSAGAEIGAPGAGLGDSGLFLTGIQTTGIDIFTLRAVTSGGLNAFEGPVSLDIGNIGGLWQIQFLGAAANGQVNVSAPGTGIGNGLGEISGIRFTTIASAPGFSAFLFIDSLNIDSFACFTAGTRIAVPGGEALVENLSEGDLVLTADGRSVLVTWVGNRVVDTRFADTAAVNPIRIRAGALGAGVPERDLLVSDDHALLVDGMLVEAGALVNGSTITREPEMPLQFTYHHVETEAHEVLLANGAPAESFIDYAGAAFDNAGERTERLTREMDVPRVTVPIRMPLHAA